MSRLLRRVAWVMVGAGVAAPLLRRRLRIPPPVVGAAAAAAPFALSVAARRSPKRDVATCVLQMWAYIAVYQMPHDDPKALEDRVHIDYPIRVDRLIGLGELPSVRLQRRIARTGSLHGIDKFLTYIHWVWFLVPHTTVLYFLLRRREQFPRSALMVYAVFDAGSLLYWVVPTAPPWYASKQGRIETADEPALRRLMYEYGEHFWGDRWHPLYGFLGGNPLAAMPSLHFATSVMAAKMLSEAGPAQGVVGWSYALTLGFALVYLGEHYVVDLLAGFTLSETIYRHGPRFKPLLERVAQASRLLEERAHG